MHVCISLKKFKDVRTGTCILNFSCIKVNFNKTIFKTTTVSSFKTWLKKQNFKSKRMKWTIDQPFLLVAVRSYISHGAVACLFLSWCRTDASRVHWSFQLSFSGYVYRVKCTANQYGLFVKQCGSTISEASWECARKFFKNILRENMSILDQRYKPS